MDINLLIREVNLSHVNCKRNYANIVPISVRFDDWVKYEVSISYDSKLRADPSHSVFGYISFKGEGSVSAIFGPIQNLIVLVIFCSNTSYNGKIGCFRLIFQVFPILGLKV